MLVERYFYTAESDGSLQEYVQDPKKPDVFHPFGNGIRRTPTKSRSYIEFLMTEFVETNKLSIKMEMVESDKYKFT